jgi:hypothetical protein
MYQFPPLTYRPVLQSKESHFENEIIEDDFWLSSGNSNDSSSSSDKYEEDQKSQNQVKQKKIVTGKSKGSVISSISHFSMLNSGGSQNSFYTI